MEIAAPLGRAQSILYSPPSAISCDRCSCMMVHDGWHFPQTELLHATPKLSCDRDPYRLATPGDRRWQCDHHTPMNGRIHALHA